MRWRSTLRQVLLRKKNLSTKPTLPHLPALCLLVCSKCPQTFLFSVMLKANLPVREAKEFLLSCVHEPHGVDGSFGFFPSNQVLASSALARVESPRTRRRGRGRREGRCELWGGGRMKLFFRWTSGAGEDDGAGRVPRAHGAEGKQDKNNVTHVCVCAFEGHMPAIKVSSRIGVMAGLKNNEYFIKY